MAIITFKEKSLLDNEWCRCGHGSYFEFYATPEEIVLLFKMTLGDLTEYDIYGAFPQKIPNTRNYQWIPFTYPLKNLVRCLSEYPTNVNYYIVHQNLTPKSSIFLSGNSITSLNGFLQLQYFTTPYSFRGKNEIEQCLQATNIGMVKTIENTKTGERITREDYFRLYKKIKNFSRKLFKYKTKIVSTDNEFEDKSCRMSDETIKMYKAGVKFAHEPILTEES